MAVRVKSGSSQRFGPKPAEPAGCAGDTELLFLLGAPQPVLGQELKAFPFGVFAHSMLAGGSCQGKAESCISFSTLIQVEGPTRTNLQGKLLLVLWPSQAFSALTHASNCSFLHKFK